MEDIEVIPRESKKMDEFEDGSDEDSSGNNSPKEEGIDKGKHHSEGKGDDRSSENKTSWGEERPC